MAETGGCVIHTLNAMLPKSLDDIVRANRDKADLALANKEQLAHLSKPVSDASYVKGDISDWRFIAITLDMPERNFLKEMVYLVGIYERSDWITSAIETIDLERRLVRTQYSVYRLVGELGVGEPNRDSLMMICAAFNSWGWGATLGVPEFFF